MNKNNHFLAVGRIGQLFLLLSILMVLTIFAPSVQAENTYGTDAYYYMKYLNDTYPDREQGSEGNRQAGLWIQSQLQSMGYQVEQLVFEQDGITFRNYIAQKPGTSAQTVYIGSHYDTVPGASRGAEDNGTGVGVNLELARRFSQIPTQVTLNFCFFDGEESPTSLAGSCNYANLHVDTSTALLYINLDSVGSGDTLYAYGGDYVDGTLVQDWGYNMAQAIASRLNIPLSSMPEGVTPYPSPTRTEASDQYYFNQQGIPYVYFEANAWLQTDRTMGNPEKPYFYNSVNPAFASTGGQIIHTAFDDLSILEKILPGIMETHMAQTSQIVSQMLTQLTPDSPAAYDAPWQTSDISGSDTSDPDAAALPQTESANADSTSRPASSAAEILTSLAASQASAENNTASTSTASSANAESDTDSSTMPTDASDSNRESSASAWAAGAAAVLLAVGAAILYRNIRHRK